MVFIKVVAFDLVPVDEVEVFFGFQEGEDFDPEWGEDDVGVARAASSETSEEDGKSEGDERHPPVKAGMAHQPSDGQEKGKGKDDSGGDNESLSLTSAGKAEFLMRLGDVFGGSHQLELVIGNIESASLVEITGTDAFEEPAHALF